MSFVPPLPIYVPGGGTSGGSIISDGSSVSFQLDPTTGVENVVLTTDDTVGLLVDGYQNVILNTSRISTISRSRLTISPDSTTNNCITLYRNDSTLSTFNLGVTGILTISNSGNPIKITDARFDIATHNGSTNGLYLGGILVKATANQMNYLLSTPGTSLASKCMVTDALNNITGINSFTATSLTGTIQTGNQPNITTLKEINITDKFSLKGFEITATALQINALNVQAGIAYAGKALVVDSNKDITAINKLTAVSLYGTIQTGPQTNITSLGLLTSLNVSGNVGIGTSTPVSKLEIHSPTVTPAILRLSTNTAYSEIYTDTSGNLFLKPNGTSIIVGESKNIILSGTNKIHCSLLEATTITGTILTASQPNITSIGTLTTLNVSSNIYLGVNSGTYKLEVREALGNCIKISRDDTTFCTFNISPSGGLIISPVSNISFKSGTSLLLVNGNITGVSSLSAISLTGTIQTGAQPNITSIGVLTNLSVTNKITCNQLESSLLAGTLQTAEQPNITSIGILSSLSVRNGISCNDLTSLTLSGTLQTASQPNITAVGILSSLTVSNLISCNTLTASVLNGTIFTASQPNITAIGRLSNLNVTNGIVCGSLSATTLTGTLQTASQPNITTIGRLNSLSVSLGISCSTLTATELTGTILTPSQRFITEVGTLSSLSVTNTIVTDTLNSSQMTGILLTPLQTNITSVGTLSKLNVTGYIGIGTTSPSFPLEIYTTTEKAICINKNDQYAQIYIDSVNDLNISGTSTKRIIIPSSTTMIMGSGTIYGLSSLTAISITGTLITASQPNITTIGTLSDLNVTNTIRIASSDTSSYGLVVGAGNGSCLKLESGTGNTTFRVIDGDLYLSPSSNNVYLSQGTNLVINGGTIKGYVVSTEILDSTIIRPEQPYITSLGTLTGLTVEGDTTISSSLSPYALIVTGNSKVDGTFYVSSTSSFLGTATFSNGISTSSILSTSKVTIDNECSVNGDFNIDGDLYMNGTLVDFSAIGLGSASIGTVYSNQLFMADSSLNLSGFNVLGCNYLSGVIQTVPQPNITSVGTLSGLNVSGYLGVGTTAPLYQIESTNVDGKCLRLSSGSNQLSFDIDSVDSSVLVSTNLNTIKFPASVGLNMDRVSIGNTTNTTMPIEIGYAPFVFNLAFAYNNSNNGHGIISAGNVNTYNYSIRALGRILCTQSVDITSDIRVKKDIAQLTDEYCAKFVSDTQPVKFKWKNGDTQYSYGYIAQDLLKHDFTELVNMDPDDSMEYMQDEDGVISPEGIKYNISYTYIIPILAQNQKRLMNENKDLLERISHLEELVKSLLGE